MKVGIYDPYLDDLGGGEKYMMTLAECLSLSNLVTVFWDKKEDLKKVAERFSLDLSRIKTEKNIFASSYPLFKRCLNSLNYDVLIILSDGSIPFVLSKKLFIHFQQPFPLIKLSLGDKIKLKKTSAFICNSSFTKSFIDKEFGINSKVIYPPVDLGNPDKHKEDIILHVGRFRTIDREKDYKKQYLMLEVFKKMIDNGLKNWKFVFAVGLLEKDKKRFYELKKKAKGYPVEFLTNLNKKELGFVYSKAKIYWHASGYGENLEKHPELAEHFGISTVEAMSAGAVPVVINAGGQKEIVKEGENGCLWNNLNELMEKTSMLVSNQENWEKMSVNAIETSRKFNKDYFCRRMRDQIR